MTIYEVSYDITKTTAKDTLTITKEILVGANSLEEVIPKFHKHFPAKRGTTFTIQSIYPHCDTEFIQ